MFGRAVRGGGYSSCRKREEAGQVFPPPHIPLAGSPAGLTEGGQPVVCWPVSINPQAKKSSLLERKNG
jgi:hypothetical protein